uniref:Putative group i salivary lipocalin n=1 Tax=Rhipicephalus pulchellus TaxID=72859 RepID=L7LSZ3_RHIPC
MLLYQMFSVLFFTISVSMQDMEDITYDEYDTTEITRKTDPPRQKITKGPKKPEVHPDIIQFLNTTDKKIWLYHSTGLENNTCRLDNIAYVYELGACLTRYQNFNGSIDQNTVEAKFSFHWMTEDYSHPYNEMQTPSEEVFNLFETIVYQSTNNECGVFYMNFHRDFNDQSTWVELRLKDSSIKSGPDQECLKTFKDYSQQKNITFTYTPQCKELFASQTN